MNSEHLYIEVFDMESILDLWSSLAPLSESFPVLSAFGGENTRMLQGLQGGRGMDIYNGKNNHLFSPNKVLGLR